ncbi:MAG TPA: amylo-alpha-1,6-glucosidase [Longimicrobiales bacterium]|nr:amylo-alpha-1,6-glucosidase [Longimicrobiales bacterium]
MDLREWLETDGLGGYASGTVSGVRTRRYHALLLSATTPPTGRYALVNGADVSVATAAGTFALSTQRYAPDVTHPDGWTRVVGFERAPWPTWRYRLEDGTEVVHELLMPRGSPVVALAWRLAEPLHEARLVVRPFLSGRDAHATHHENGALRFDAEVSGDRVGWRTYEGVPGVVARTNGVYRPEPLWYRGFQYDEERARGLDFLEDLAAPGTFEFDLGRGDAVLLLGMAGAEAERALAGATAESAYDRLRTLERERRAGFRTPLERAADPYLVRRGEGLSIVAGYPWFSDWGRDTFIALRGVCLATGRLAEARRILLAWAGLVSEGMLPNYFPEGGQAPEYNSVDASLWFVVAVHELKATLRRRRARLPAAESAALDGAVQAILEGYSRGTRFGIRADGDGLLAAGEPGVQLTWMDARVDGREVTPRIGKPVEVQALWINALRIGGPAWAALHDRARASFRARFPCEARGFLYDVVDVGHRPGAVDASLRPNQVLAVGGLPFPVLDPADPEDAEWARCVVDAVERALWTPLGLRTLAPREPGYAPRYEGGVARRDGAYHQGTVWPWLAGPFVDAWVRVRGGSDAAKAEAQVRFVAPLLRHLEEAGLGHVSEIADAEPPHTPRGAPFQAWSVGELLRLLDVTLSPATTTTVRARRS